MGNTSENRQVLSEKEIPEKQAPASKTMEEIPATSPDDLLFYLKTILGYTIKNRKNTFILRSVYAFCEEDVFEIEIINNRLILKHTEYLDEWKEHVHTYVTVGRSYSAFFSAVTLDLFNKRTFG